jgi:CheY-like chemotaxis protein
LHLCRLRQEPQTCKDIDLSAVVQEVLSVLHSLLISVTSRCQRIWRSMAERAAPGILLIEDNDEDYVVAQHILRRVTNRPIIHCTDGDSALAYLSRRGASAEGQQALRPALILLDLNLPTTDGYEVLRQIKQDARLRTIPVVVLTTSANPRDVDLCYRYGANSYIVKPVDFERLRRSLELLTVYWFEVATLPEGRVS